MHKKGGNKRSCRLMTSYTTHHNCQSDSAFLTELGELLKNAESD